MGEKATPPSPHADIAPAAAKRSLLVRRPVLVPFGGIGVALMLIATSSLMLWRARADAEAAWSNEAASVSLLIAEHAHQTIKAADLVLQRVAEQIAGADVASQADLHADFGTRSTFDVLNDLIKGVPQVAFASIVDLSGDFVASSRDFPAPKFNSSDREYFQQHMTDPKLTMFISRPIKNRVDGKWTIVISRKMRGRSGQTVALAYVGMEVDFFGSFYERVSSSGNFIFSVYRDDGILLVRYPTAEGMLGQDMTSKSAALQALQATRADSTVLMTSAPRPVDEADKTLRILAPRRVPDYPMIVNVTVLEQQIFDRWRASAQVVWVCIGAAVLLVLAVTTWLTRLLERQDRTTSELDEKTRLALQQSRELELTAARQDILERDSLLKAQILTFDQRLRGSVQRLGTMIRTIADLSEQMSEAAGSAHAGGEKAEFASTRAASLVGQAADRAGSISLEGEAIVTHSKKSLALSEDVIVDAEDTDKAIRGLTSATQQIDRVAALIGQVASQTNLLALNATIEAARAGEAGRGFAVVATEIKSLAAQTTSATGEIGLQIQAIHEASRNCGQALQTIRARTLSTREIAGEVVDRVSTQSVLINEIAGTIHQAAQETRGVLSSATEVHQAADLSNASAIDVLRLARDLDAEAKAIQSEIETFFAEHDAKALTSDRAVGEVIRTMPSNPKVLSSYPFR